MTIILALVYAQSFAQPIIQRIKNKEVRFCNLFTGKPICETKFKNASNFEDGYAIVQNDKDLWGILDSTGKLIIKCEYKKIFLFTGDYSIAESAKGYGILNKHGDTVLPFKFQLIDNIVEGIASLKQNDKWGTIDIATGNQGLPFEYPNALYFSEGLAATSIKNNELEYINRSGQTIISCSKYTRCYPFSGGLAVGKKGDDYFVINKEGKKAFKQSFKKAGRLYSEGLLYVSKGLYDDYGYIDTLGNWVIKPIFYSANSFKNGLAIAMGQIIDRTGKIKIHASTSSWRELAPGIIAHNWDPEYYYNINNDRPFIPDWMKKEEQEAIKNQWNIEGKYKLESKKAGCQSAVIQVSRDNTKIGNYYIFTGLSDKPISLELVVKETEKLYAPKTMFKTAETEIISASGDNFGVLLYSTNRDIFLKYLQFTHGELSLQIYSEGQSQQEGNKILTRYNSCNYYGNLIVTDLDKTIDELKKQLKIQ